MTSSKTYQNIREESEKNVLKVHESNEMLFKYTENAFKVHENNEMLLKCAKNALKHELSTQEEMIVKYIADNGKITSLLVMTLLGIKKRRSQIILSNLINKGILCKEGASRNTCYVFNEALKKN